MSFIFVFAGSKEETFFDSQAWLDSDCEDDFFSVNGGKKMLYCNFACKNGPMGVLIVLELDSP